MFLCQFLTSDAFLSCPKGTWSPKDKSPSFSSSPSLLWLSWWYISTIKASAQTVMACSCSVVSVLLCSWWLSGWYICGMTQCYAASTLGSFMYQNPGPTTPYISRTTDSHVFKSLFLCVGRKGIPEYLYIRRHLHLSELMQASFILFSTRLWWRSSLDCETQGSVYWQSQCSVIRFKNWFDLVTWVLSCYIQQFSRKIVMEPLHCS